ncbi:phosphoserine phosphatase SerB [Campylobacter estrildidarum]|uniref:Phosphoserine phosphatase n=1 Tax=Campylobacter estrildidarum TaxID=2510189 RepID=A0A4U7BHL5_9BACT|nr:phosphoserine phosphatase SerB [Campylobacter estrildidarum]TKX31233.1 phosphoserine phosphatase SerB [Campylobacter estrildidarum]
MIKLCVFDFDSTLMDGETIDILADFHGVGDKVKNIAHSPNKLDFFEALLKKVSYLKGMPYTKVLEIGQKLPLMNGAYELCEFLKSKNILLIICSGGFYEGINPAMEKLGFNMGFANHLHQKNGVLSGLVGGEMMFLNSKGLMLQKLKKMLHLKSEEIMCVGDGFNDIAMFEESGLKIAFCANETLKSKADICIDKKDLKEIIKAI